MLSLLDRASGSEGRFGIAMLSLLDRASGSQVKFGIATPTFKFVHTPCDRTLDTQQEDSSHVGSS